MKDNSHRKGRKGRGGKARARKQVPVKTVRWLIIDHYESRRDRFANSHHVLIPNFLFLVFVFPLRPLRPLR